QRRTLFVTLHQRCGSTRPEVTAGVARLFRYHRSRLTAAAGLLRARCFPTRPMAAVTVAELAGGGGIPVGILGRHRVRESSGRADGLDCSSPPPRGRVMARQVLRELRHDPPTSTALASGGEVPS